MKETIFKAQVYNDSEKSRVKQHKIFRDYLSVTANLKFAVSFLANDVTLVTSYGYCQSLKINDIREHETNVRRLSYDL